MGTHVLKRSAAVLAFLNLIGTLGPRPVLAQRVDWEKVRVLVYTKNGKGYVHDNIPNSIEAIQALGKEYGFLVESSADPAVFTERNLKKYRALIFANTNNVVFDTDAQRVALMRYVEAGGGFVGIHSASGTERSWKWFKQMLGGTFYWHEPFQKFEVIVLDHRHPSLSHLPGKWDREDECYYLKELNVNMNILAVNDLGAFKEPRADRPNTFGDVFPSVWCQEFDGGRQWYTSLGHRKEDYKHPDFRRHILGGLQWVLGGQAPLDYGKAYATSPHDEARKPANNL